ncbi:hypothetical protein FPQ18DRAFT_394149 [Pyronema domesticum]|nr:hypothetical protein FPQ18DRAFT_394149 [Pyronema domesticum]
MSVACSLYDKKSIKVEPKVELSLTPLSLAALASHAHVAKFLSDHTGNAKALDSVRWQSGEAKSDAYGEKLKFFLERYGCVKSDEDFSENTPSIPASEYGINEVVLLLLERDLNLSAKDKFYTETPTTAAVKDDYDSDHVTQRGNIEKHNELAVELRLPQVEYEDGELPISIAARQWWTAVSDLIPQGRLSRCLRISSEISKLLKSYIEATKSEIVDAKTKSLSTEMDSLCATLGRAINVVTDPEHASMTSNSTNYILILAFLDFIQPLYEEVKTLQNCSDNIASAVIKSVIACPLHQNQLPFSVYTIRGFEKVFMSLFTISSRLVISCLR